MRGYRGPKEIVLRGGPLDGAISRHPLADPDTTPVPLINDDGTLIYRAEPRSDDNLELDENGRLILHFQGYTEYLIGGV